MNIFKKGAFSYDPNMTPQQLADKRAMLAMLQPKYGKASYIGEGLGQLATGVATGIRTRKLDEIEGKGREQGANLFSGLFGGTTQSTSGQSGPMNILGVDPGYGDPNDPVNIAGDTMTALGKDQGTAGYRASLIGTESGGNWGAQNNEMGAGGKRGHYGRVQFGQARLQEAMDAGAIPQGTTPEQFMASPALQIAAENWHFGDLEKQLAPYVGAVVNGQTMDLGALVAMGHLGGAAGAKRFVESGGKYNPSDAYGTSLLDYARTHGGRLGGPVAAPAGASTATNSAMPSIDPQALAAALANPWLSPEERSVLTTIYDQQVQAGDPLRQIEVAKGMAELDKLNAPPAPPEELLTRLALLDAAGVDRNSPEGRSFLLSGKTPGTDAATEYGTTLQFWTDNDGKTKAGVIGKDGTMKTIAPPDGGDWATGIEKVDAGTKWLIYDKRTGQKIGEEVKDIAGAEKEKVIGEAEGKSTVAAEADMAAADDALAYIESLRSHPGREWATGGSSWTGWIPGTDSKEFQIEVDRLASGAFMTAIQQLRGMGSLSNAEGQTATAAVAALSTEGTEEGFMKRLAEYEGIIKRGRERAAKRIRVEDNAAAPAAGGGTTRKRYNPATGAFE